MSGIRVRETIQAKFIFILIITGYRCGLYGYFDKDNTVSGGIRAIWVIVSLINGVIFGGGKPREGFSRVKGATCYTCRTQGRSLRGAIKRASRSGRGGVVDINETRVDGCCIFIVIKITEMDETPPP